MNETNQITPSERKREAGRRGGIAVSQNKSHMQEIGRKGGAATSANRQHMSEIGKLGGHAVSRNSQHMAEIGRKGGLSRGRANAERKNIVDTALDNDVVTDE